MEITTLAKASLSTPTQVYQVFIRSTPERIWQAVTEAKARG